MHLSLSSFINIVLIQFLIASSFSTTIAAEQPTPSFSQCAIQTIQSITGTPDYLATLETIYKDPKISQTIKNTISQAFTRQRINIAPLTDDIRQAANLPQNASAMVKRSVQFTNFPSGKKGVVFHKQDLSNPSYIYHEQTIFLGEGQKNPPELQLIMLIHELAHVRFDDYLRQNLDRLQNLFPEQYIQMKSKQEFIIDRELMKFLHERFAYEKQYKFIQEAQGRYIKNIGPYFDYLAGPSNFNVIHKINDDIIAGYNITDPTLIDLFDGRTLNEILTKGLKHRVSRKIISPPTFERVSREEGKSIISLEMKDTSYTYTITPPQNPYLPEGRIEIYTNNLKRTIDSKITYKSLLTSLQEISLKNKQMKDFLETYAVENWLKSKL